MAAPTVGTVGEGAGVRPRRHHPPPAPQSGPREGGCSQAAGEWRSGGWGGGQGGRFYVSGGAARRAYRGWTNDSVRRRGLTGGGRGLASLRPRSRVRPPPPGQSGSFPKRRSRLVAYLPKI